MIRKFNKGGYAEIWLAEKDGQQVVVKKQWIKKLDWKGLVEWNTFRHCDHKHIISAHECYYDPEKQTQLIIFDYAEFGDLGHLIRAVRE